MKNTFDSDCAINKNKKFKYHGKILAASKDVYLAIKRPIWREKKRRQRAAQNPEKKIVVISLDALLECGISVTDPESVEEIVEENNLLERLRNALTKLTKGEQELVNALYYNGLTERKLSSISGIPQQTINSRRAVVIKKLKKILK